MDSIIEIVLTYTNPSYLRFRRVDVKANIRKSGDNAPEVIRYGIYRTGNRSVIKIPEVQRGGDSTSYTINSKCEKKRTKRVSLLKIYKINFDPRPYDFC